VPVCQPLTLSIQLHGCQMPAALQAASLDAGESGWNTIWRVLNGEVVAPTACPKLFQVYSVRTGLSPTARSPHGICLRAVPYFRPFRPV